LIRPEYVARGKRKGAIKGWGTYAAQVARQVAPQVWAVVVEAYAEAHEIAPLAKALGALVLDFRSGGLRALSNPGRKKNPKRRPYALERKTREEQQTTTLRFTAPQRWIVFSITQIGDPPQARGMTTRAAGNSQADVHAANRFLDSIGAGEGLTAPGLTAADLEARIVAFVTGDLTRANPGRPAYRLTKRHPKRRQGLPRRHLSLKEIAAIPSIRKVLQKAKRIADRTGRAVRVKLSR
jgi:hypothetical protein